MPHRIRSRPRRSVALAALPIAALIALGALKVAIPAAGQVPSSATPDVRVLGHPPKDKVSPQTRAVLDADERAWREALKQPPRPHEAATPGPPRTPPHLHTADEQPAGAGTIFPGGSFPRHTRDRYENRWVEQQASGAIGVFAGAEGADPQQGLVAVAVSTDGGLGVQYYRAPVRAGSLHIIGAQGERLTLLAKDGTTFSFDVPTRTFTRG